MKTTRQLVNETAFALSALLPFLNGCNDEKVDALLDREDVNRARYILNKILRDARDKSEEMDRELYPLSEDRVQRMEAQDEN